MRHPKYIARGVILALFVHNTKTHWGGDPMCGPHPNVPWCCVIIVQCECFDHFSYSKLLTLTVK